MLAEIRRVCERIPIAAPRDHIARAITDSNLLAKRTTATRKLTHQRLSELYALSPDVPIYRVLRRLWNADAMAGPQLAMLVALARDPLFGASAAPVLALQPGDVFRKADLKSALRKRLGERLNDSILDKVARNAASSWTQGGVLRGRANKTRTRVVARPATGAMALYLATASGFDGLDVFGSAWFRALDANHAEAQQLALEAKRQGLVGLRIYGNVVDLDLSRLDRDNGTSVLRRV